MSRVSSELRDDLKNVTTDSHTTMKPASVKIIDKMIVASTALFESLLRALRVFRGYSSFLTLNGNAVVLPFVVLLRTRLCMLPKI